MDSHARDACSTARPGAARAACGALRVVVLVAVAVAMASVGGSASIASAAGSSPSAAAAPSPRSQTDAQLTAAIERLQAEAAAIGQRLLAADARRDALARERDAARSILARFMAASYKRASTDGGLARQLLTAGSVAEVADRVRVAEAIGGYHANVVRSLDDAEARLDVSSVERAQLIARLGAIQARLAPLQGEQARRDAHRAQLAADRARARAERAAAREQRRRERERDQGMLVASAPAAALAAPGSPPTAPMLDAYLASKGSPMAGQGAAFMASAQRWRVDPRLLVAIAGAESSFGQITCGPHNAWGWACPNDPADFATWADGIDTVTEGLRRYYLDEGRTSVPLINQKYAPIGAANDPTGLNNHWTRNVSKFLVELGGNPANVGPGPSGADALQLPGFGVFAID